MNPVSFGRLVNSTRQNISRIRRSPSPLGYALFLFLIVFIEPVLRAQQPADQTPSSAATNSAPKTPAEQLAALELERTNAWQRVLEIVNQPVHAFVRPPHYPVSVYPGWFHAGATKPDFNTVDVRQSQELVYTNRQYVTSDLNPGMMFLGRELEFNGMTKFFYTNRSLPKHKLSEAEMIEINQLYRIIGRCDGEIDRLQTLSTMESVKSSQAEDESESVAPGQPLTAIRSISQKTRGLYGGIAIGVLILLVLVSRLFRKKSD